MRLVLIIIVFSIIRQNHSLARANIKRESFEKLVSDHDIFAPFLNVVHSFGVKTDVDENVWDGFYAAVSPECSKDGSKNVSSGQLVIYAVWAA
jgi:hypothetical protein